MKTKLVAATILTMLISACATDPAATGTSAATAQSSPQEPASSRTQSGTEIKSAPETTASQLQEMQHKSIYFDRDQFTIKSEYNSIIQQQAEFAKAHGQPLTLEGNADERGSSEYNLALGSKRANAVKKSLEILGVPAKQIKSLSFGEEKPKASCHEEKCWQENRRVDFNGKSDL